MISRIFVPFDSGSRQGGAWRAPWTLRRRAGDSPGLALEREHGALVGPMLETEVRTRARRGQRPMIYGGDHSITFWIVRALYSVHGSFTIVHFDAHHDRYEGAELNHYTVFHHLAALPLEVIGLGYRHDMETPLSPTLERPVSGPVYVSMDVDYFAPELVADVGDAVPCAEGKRADLSTFEASLEAIEGPIIGADVVEWFGAHDNPEEVAFVSEVARRLEERLLR